MEKKKYTPGQSVQDAKDALEAHKGKKPGEYHSQWKESADAVLGQIQNRDPFSYNAAADPMYRQAVDQYVRLGRQAMMDTVGQVSALTGGYGNSYAMTAGQHSFQGYLQALSSRMPQFQKMALDRYQAQGKDLLDRYQALSQREKDAYGQYQKTLEQYFAQQDRLQSAYDREQDRDYHRYTDDRDYAYAQEQDALEAERQAAAAQKEQERWEKDREYKAQQDKIRQEQWEREFQEDRRRYELEWAAGHAAPSGGGGGGGGRGGRGGSRNSGKYRIQNGVKGKEYDKEKKAAQEHFHYGKRPNGSPWSPRNRGWERPMNQVTLR